MKLKDRFIIYFSSLSEGENQLEFTIDDIFFEKFDNELDFSNCNLDLFLQLDKKTSLIEFFYKIKGKVTLQCDLTLESFDFNINSEKKIILKFGEEYNDHDEDIIELPRKINSFDISQHIYEIVILAIPNKKIHPKILSGEMKSDILDKLERYLVNQINSDEVNENVDPR